MLYLLGETTGELKAIAAGCLGILKCCGVLSKGLASDGVV